MAQSVFWLGLVKGSDGSVNHCCVAMAALLPAVETDPFMWISFEIMESVVENIGKTSFLPQKMVDTSGGVYYTKSVRLSM